jgi:hypothetical protein
VPWGVKIIARLGSPQLPLSSLWTGLRLHSCHLPTPDGVWKDIFAPLDTAPSCGIFILLSHDQQLSCCLEHLVETVGWHDWGDGGGMSGERWSTQDTYILVSPSSKLRCKFVPFQTPSQAIGDYNGRTNDNPKPSGARCPYL